MKIQRIETLISAGSYPASAEWRDARAKIHDAIKSIDWPNGSGSFTIYPESGKKRGEGNGVKPIKIGLRKELVEDGWIFESPSNIPSVVRPGPLDALIKTESGNIAVEWETGNVSSSHRALNKLILGLLNGNYIAGVLVVPTKKLAQYLTDRIGTLDELLPYKAVWTAHNGSIANGVLEIVETEHDAVSTDVPRIPKGTDGRAAA